MAFAPGSSKSVFGFDPRSIPGCALWLDGSDVSTFTFSSGSNVSVWRDKSANGSNAVTSAGSPTVAYNAVGGRSTVYFSNAPYMTSPLSMPTTGSLTVFSVVKTSYVGGGGFYSVFSINGGGSGTRPNDLNMYQAYYGKYWFSGGTGGTDGNTETMAASGNYEMIGGYWSPSSGTQVFGNGVLYSASLSAPTSLSTGGTMLIGAACAPAEFWYGHIAEIIMYSNTLTTLQRQQVEGYLAWKWGFQTSINSPTSISGLALWLDAADASTLTLSGSNITSWNDKSGNGNNATATGTPTYNTAGLNSRPATAFNGSCYFQGNVSITGQTLTCFAVGSFVNSGGGDQRFVSLAATGQADWNSASRVAAIFNQGSTTSIASYRNQPASFSRHSHSYGTPFIACSVYDGTNGYIYVNGLPGNVQASYASVGTFAISKYCIGEQVSVTGEIIRNGGFVSEVLTYTTALTTVQRQQVEGYLSKKWGVSLVTRLPTTHPFYSIGPGLRTFRPIDIDGCALWLDANDATTFTLSGSNITSWNDKSGNGNNANIVTATPPTYSSANKAVVFAAASAMGLRGNMSASLSNASVFVVASYTSNSATPALPRLFGLGSNNSTENFLIGQFSLINQSMSVVVTYIGNLSGNAFGDANYQSGGTISYATPFLYTNISTYSGSAFTNFTLVNGAAGTFASKTGTQATGSFYVGSANRYAIGNSMFATPGANGDSYNGNVYEVIVYPSALTTAQRQQVEGYLAKKWNLSTVVPPFTNPTSIPGCTLWLDAQDSSTITGTSTVTQWRDKSSNGYHTTSSVGSPALTTNAINGYQAIYLNGNSYMLGTNANTSTTATFFLVATAAASLTAGGQIYTCPYTFSRTINSITSGNFTCYGEPQSMSGPVFAGDSPAMSIQAQRPTVSGQSFSPGYNTPFVHTVVFDGSTVKSYGGGTLLGSSSSSGNFAYVAYSVGCQTAGYFGGPAYFNYFWTGYIGELVAYNTALSATQRQQVEYYLSTKWGLTAATSFSPSMIPNTLLWFDASDTSTLSNTGSTVNSWRSKGSFIGTAASNAGTATTGVLTLNGKNVVTIAAGAKLAFTTAAANQARTYFVVSRVTQRITYATYPFVVPGYVVNATNGTGQDYFFGPAFALGTGGEQLIRISQPGITDTIGTTYCLSPAAGNWLVYSAVNSAVATSSNCITVNGDVIPLSVSSLASGYPTGSYTRTIGSGGTVAYDLAELIMINGEVTSTQRQQMEYYLANKWGLLTLSTFAPTVISNCLLWLDAADTSTITTSGTQVTQWRNKGTFDAFASNKTGVVTSGTATYNGRNIVQFPQSTNLAITMLIPNQPRAWFAVFRQTYQLNAQNPYFQIFGHFANSSYDQIYGPDFSGNMDEFRNSVAGMVSTTSATTGYNLFRIYNWTNSAASTSSNRIAINGTALTLTTSSLAAGYGTGSVEYLIMNGYLPSADLAELICINAEITVLQRQQIEYYLSQKWGIAGPAAPAYYGPSNVTFGPQAISFAGSTTSALPTTHPFVKIPPSTALPFSPLQITGCVLWLDANDPAGTGVQPSAGALATWTDKSGSSNHMTAAGTTPTFSNVPPGAVTFGGAGYYSKASAVFSNIYTAFFVYKQTAAAGPLYTTGASSGSNGLFPNESGTTYFTRGDSTWYTVSSPFTSNVTNLAGVSFSSNAVGSNQSLFYNGSNVVTTTQANTITYTNLLIGSRQSGGTQYFTGSIYEVLAYGGTLTTNERQRVEGYLAQKWKV